MPCVWLLRRCRASRVRGRASRLIGIVPSEFACCQRVEQFEAIAGCFGLVCQNRLSDITVCSVNSFVSQERRGYTSESETRRGAVFVKVIQPGRIEKPGGSAALQAVIPRVSSELKRSCCLGPCCEECHDDYRQKAFDLSLTDQTRYL